MNFFFAARLNGGLNGATPNGGDNLIVKVILLGLWKSLPAQWIGTFYEIFGTCVCVGNR